METAITAFILAWKQNDYSDFQPILFHWHMC